jgi:hypothetical protein
MLTLNLKPAHKAVKAYLDELPLVPKFPLVPKLHLGTQILPQALLGDLR